MGNQASQSSKYTTSMNVSNTKESSQRTSSLSERSSNSDFVVDTIAKFGLLEDIRNIACDNVLIL